MPATDEVRNALIWKCLNAALPIPPPPTLSIHFTPGLVRLALSHTAPICQERRTWDRYAAVQWRNSDGERLYVDLQRGDCIARFTAADPKTAVDRAYAFVMDDAESTEGLTPYLRGGPPRELD